MQSPLYHGAGTAIAPGTRLRPRIDAFNYLSTTERFADAFAYRAAASTAVHRALERAQQAGMLGNPLVLNSGVSRVTGFVHTVETSGALRIDPDFHLNCDQAYRTGAAVTVVSSKPGSVNGWREFTSIVGPYQYWIEKTPAFDEDGYLLPPPLWKSWGYNKDAFRALGPWFPFGSVWEDRDARTLWILSEVALPFLDLPQGQRRAILNHIGARADFTPENAERARESWWQ